MENHRYPTELSGWIGAMGDAFREEYSAMWQARSFTACSAMKKDRWQGLIIVFFTFRNAARKAEGIADFEVEECIDELAQ
jgi:hypothetical protein